MEIDRNHWITLWTRIHPPALWMQRRHPTSFWLSWHILMRSDRYHTAASPFHQTARHCKSLLTNSRRWKNDTWPSQIKWRSKTLFFDPKNSWQTNILCFCQFLRNAKHSWNLKTPQLFWFDKMVRYDTLWVVYKQCQLLLWTAIIFLCCSSWSTKFKRD